MAVAIAVTRERREGEPRTAATPDPVKKLTALGASVLVAGFFFLKSGKTSAH